MRVGTTSRPLSVESKSLVLGVIYLHVLRIHQC
jgi:hypothetical protein